MYEGKWEKRWHPLREEWVVYAAHRNVRPWQGAPPVAAQPAPEYDHACYLCPGNARVAGHVNPQYKDIFIFDNDHPVVGMNAPGIKDASDHLYRKGKAIGVSKVICYDPRHNITLSEMKLSEVSKVFQAFRDEMRLLTKNSAIHSVLIFENKGEAVGVSNPHPHCQVYATDFPFKLVEQQNAIAGDYRISHNSGIFSDIIERERKDDLRILAENKNAIAFIPFFARYAYEVMIFPKSEHQTLITMSDEELSDLAAVFHKVARLLDMNYQMRFPYVMSVMQAPLRDRGYGEFRMHLWLQPPYRQPGLIKYLAGPEIGAGNFMSDTIPEEKAAELRKLDVNLYPFER
jgi:UDPglucose--hexose-1-phosphate uridylyltransferase